ncbi:MAG: MogA/MoaB family molybdenum cofactor biosynthesis protein [Pyrinomonadaceae bacterium]|nr:MogA/MoaB family molybdenum cofactor biosynthesis protein [Pyrinomonadaceae bacterium]
MMERGAEEEMEIKAAVVTISDSRTPNDDLSGERLAELLAAVGARIVRRLIVSDDRVEIEAALRSLSDGDANLIITTGGTGFAPRDNTPEATRAVIEREAPGMAEAMRRDTASRHPMAMLSRGVCGIRGRSLIVNLPGSPKGVEECFEVIRPVLRHAVDLIAGKTEH